MEIWNDGSINEIPSSRGIVGTYKPRQVMAAMAIALEAIGGSRTRCVGH